MIVKIKNFLYDKMGYVYVCLSVVILIFMVYLCNYQTIWYDEAFSLSLINKPLREIISLTAMDVHPPLYYIILKFAISCFPNANQVLVGKIMSVIPVIILCIFATLYAKKTNGFLVASMFGFSIVAMPKLFQSGIEMRMYSYALLFVSLGIFFTIEILKRNTKMLWMGYSFMAVLAMYTHYFAAMAFIVLYIIIFFSGTSKHKKQSIISGIINIIFYIPWIHILINQLKDVKKEYWISEITIKNIIGFFVYPFELEFNIRLSEIIDIIITLLMILVVVFAFIKNKDINYRKKIIVLTGVFVGVIILGILISWIYTPVLYKRYLIPCLAGIWFAVCISADCLCRNTKLKIIVLFIMFVGISNVGTTFLNEVWQQINLDYFNEKIVANIESNQNIIHSSEHSAGCMDQIGDYKNVIWGSNITNEEVILKVFDDIENVVNMPIDKKNISHLYQNEECWYFIRRYEKNKWNHFFNKDEYMGQFYIFNGFYDIYFVKNSNYEGTE